MNKFIPEHIRSTLKINPEKYSAQVSADRFMSFGYALAGLVHMLRYAKNTRIQIVAALVAIALGIWLKIKAVEWAILVLIIAMNGFAEFINAAIEYVVNLASPEFHPLAQLAKDIAAGAVLLMSIAALVIGILLLGPPLWERIS